MSNIPSIFLTVEKVEYTCKKFEIAFLLPVLLLLLLLLLLPLLLLLVLVLVLVLLVLVLLLLLLFSSSSPSFILFSSFFLFSLMHNSKAYSVFGYVLFLG